MPDRIFGEREKAMEEAYFRQADAKLIDELRRRAPLDEIALSLKEKLQVDNPDLLRRIVEGGVTAESAAALFVAPLVQVAWAEGSVSKAEHDAVMRLARKRGIEPGTAAAARLEEWLKERPSDSIFDTAIETLKYGFAVLPQAEADERIRGLVDACQEVAAASGKGLAPLLGLGSTISSSEASMLDDIRIRLRQPR